MSLLNEQYITIVSEVSNETMLSPWLLSGNTVTLANTLSRGAFDLGHWARWNRHVTVASAT